MAEIHTLHGNTARGQKAGMLSIQHVSKAFAIKGATLPVLEDVSLDIQAGEFVAIVGVSGCGKSTLLRLLAGLDRDYAGDLLYDGQPITGSSLERGLVFQDHRLFPWRTVYQNVALAFSSTKLGKEERHRRVLDQIEQVGLGGFADAYPHQLSGGMSQRAAIARALAPRPRVLLLDEPLGALDALTRLRLQQELRRLWQEEGITMVMVTHDIDEAVFLADRVVVMEPRPGRIRRMQKMDLPHPRNRGDAGFIAIRDSLLADFSEDLVEEPAERRRALLRTLSRD